MTMPRERTRCVIHTEAFLRELSKSLLIPEEYRNEARRLLRHYPESSFVLYAGKMDDIIQGAEPGDPRYPSGQVIYSVPHNHGSAPPTTTNWATNTFGLYTRAWLKAPLAYLGPSRGMRRAFGWPALRLLKLP